MGRACNYAFGTDGAWLAEGFFQKSEIVAGSDTSRLSRNSQAIVSIVLILNDIMAVWNSYSTNFPGAQSSSSV